MNEEQTTPASQAIDPKNDTSKVLPGDTTSQSTDDYYSVDNPKKHFNTNIGDGEMKNEGTVGEGNTTDDENPLAPSPQNPVASTPQSDEQDAVDNHDSEG